METETFDAWFEGDRYTRYAATRHTLRAGISIYPDGGFRLCLLRCFNTGHVEAGDLEGDLQGPWNFGLIRVHDEKQGVMLAAFGPEKHGDLNKIATVLLGTSWFGPVNLLGVDAHTWELTDLSEEHLLRVMKVIDEGTVEEPYEFNGRALAIYNRQVKEKHRQRVMET